MREIKDIDSQIADFESQVESLETQKSEADAKLEAARRRHSESIVNFETPETIGEFRKEVSGLSIDVDALEGAVSLVLDDLKKAENERKIVQLYQGEGFRHISNMSSVAECVLALNKDLPRLKSLVLSISDTIANAVSGVENACSALDSVEKGLDQTLSLESFLDGHLCAVGDEDRASLIDDIGDGIRNSVSTLDIPDTGNLPGLQDSLTSLLKWKALITSFQAGRDLIRNPKRLFNPAKKRPSTQRISPQTFPHSNPEPALKPPTPVFDKNRSRGDQQVIS